MPAKTPSSALSLRHRVLLSLMVIGCAVAAGGGGTLASFNAQSQNAPNLATVTLLLGATTTATECLSTASSGGATTVVSTSNTNIACSAVFAVAGGAALPGTVFGPFRTQVTSHANVTASALKLHANGVCASSATAGAVYSGGTNVCPTMQAIIASTNSAFTYQTCIYGSGVGTTPITGCAFDAQHTLGELGTYHKLGDVAAGLFGEAGGPFTVATNIASGATSYFVMYILLPANSSTTSQGMKASLVFDWRLEQ